MTVECYDCGYFNGRDGGGTLLDVAHVGLGRCPFHPKAGHYVSGGYPRECKHFTACGKGKERRAWVAKQSTLKVQPVRRAA